MTDVVCIGMKTFVRYRGLRVRYPTITCFSPASLNHNRFVVSETNSPIVVLTTERADGQQLVSFSKPRPVSNISSSGFDDSQSF